jgi:hypothetical protein
MGESQHRGLDQFRRFGLRPADMNRHVEGHAVRRARGTTAINVTHRDSRGKIDDADAGDSATVK